jgi:AcrR family transcriptional regulator
MRQDPTEHPPGSKAGRAARSGAERPLPGEADHLLPGEADRPARGEAGRPLRSDAERNRRRILESAAEVFTAQGLDATLDDVARHAGVGVGTVYRRFPDKESLIGVLFEERIDALVQTATQALAEPDPWTGLVCYLGSVAEQFANDHGLRQLLMYGRYGADQTAYAREKMAPLVRQLVERAQAAGQLRDDIRATDIPFIAFILGTAGEYGSAARPGIWRRYLDLFLDALRPARDGTTPLATPALSPSEMTLVIGSSGPRYPRRH